MIKAAFRSFTIVFLAATFMISGTFNISANEQLVEGVDYVIADFFNAYTGEFLYSERMYAVPTAELDEIEDSIGTILTKGSEYIPIDPLLNVTLTGTVTPQWRPLLSDNNWLTANVRFWFDLTSPLPPNWGQLAMRVRIDHRNGTTFGNNTLLPRATWVTIRGVPSGGYTVVVRSNTNDTFDARLIVTDWP